MALEGLGAWSAQPRLEAGGQAWQQYRYNGKERDTLTGWYDYGARWYLDGIGRFPSVDPLADHPNQVDKSPYAYSWNNPVLLNDPDGRCPHCLPALATRAISGFIAGAAIDYGMQVAGNMVFGGQDLPSAMTNVSGRSILISGGAGALSGGMAAPVNATRTVMAKHFAINLGIDVAESTAKQLSGDDKSWTIEQTISDVTMSRAAGGLTSGIKGPVNTSTSSYVYRNADRTARIMANDPSSGRVANAAAAKANIQRAHLVNLTATNSAGEATENTLQKTSDAVRGILPLSRPSAPPYLPSSPSVQRDNTRVVVSQVPYKTKID